MINWKELIAVAEVEGGESTQEVQHTTEPSTQPNETQSTEPEIVKYDIDGEQFTVDEIREWRKGNLRQADYTRKTQELAKQRKEAQEALEVYNYLMSNQELVKKLVELDTENPVGASKAKEKLDPVRKELEDLKVQMKIKDLDVELAEITRNDKMVSDIELLKIANESKCDLRTAYNIWRGNNFDKIMAEKEKELTKRITEKIQKNADTTRTLISPADESPEVKTYGLSELQLAYAQKLGMTPEEYARYNSNYKMK